MSAKYFKRGTREYFQVTPERVLRIINKDASSYVTIAAKDIIDNSTMRYIYEDALEGVEISREEFAKEFEVASRLIVLEP